VAHGSRAGWTKIARSPRTVENQICKRSSARLIESHSSDNRNCGPRRRRVLSLFPTAASTRSVEFATNISDVNTTFIRHLSVPEVQKETRKMRRLTYTLVFTLLFAFQAFAQEHYTEGPVWEVSA
jgi:hypothetical protein